MMSDYWSLIDNIEESIDGYTFDSIEILRQKLICDVEDLFSNSDWTQDFAEEVKDIINKRFGKDETDVSSEPDQRVGNGVEQ